MIRTITWRGFRSVAPQLALPRETQAAAQVVQQLDQKADKLAKAPTTDAVREVLSEGFAEAMLAMALRRDPHVSMWGRASWVLHATNATTLQTAQLFGSHTATGAAGSGVAGIYNNLISPRKPLKPALVHSVGAIVVCSGIPVQLAQFIGFSRLSLQRGKEVIFELPLASALSGVVWVDHASLNMQPVVDVEMAGGGGIELEGHGAPYALADDIGVELACDGPLAPGGASTYGNNVSVLVRIDGETME